MADENGMVHSGEDQIGKMAAAYYEKLFRKVPGQNYSLEELQEVCRNNSQMIKFKCWKLPSQESSLRGVLPIEFE